MFNNSLPYREQVSFETRIAEANQLRSKYPHRIPIVFECHKKESIQIKSDERTKKDKRKFLFPYDTYVYQLIIVIRSRFSLTSEQSVFISTDNGTILNGMQQMDDIYKQHRDAD